MENVLKTVVTATRECDLLVKRVGERVGLGLFEIEYNMRISDLDCLFEGFVEIY